MVAFASDSLVAGCFFRVIRKPMYIISRAKASSNTGPLICLFTSAPR